MPLEWLPPVFESTEIAGAGDQAAGALGVGIVDPGPVSVVLGTSGVVFAVLPGYAPDAEARVHVFCHAVPGTWHAMGVMLSAAGSLSWFRHVVGAGYPELDAEAARWEPGAEGLLFAPYVQGERTPHADPDVRGAFTGLSLRHDRGALTRAVLEGVAYGLRDSLELLRALGVQPTVGRVSGGGARSDIWVRIVASVLGLPLERMESEAGAAFGAALLAGVREGVFADAGGRGRALRPRPGPHRSGARLGRPVRGGVQALRRALSAANVTAVTGIPQTELEERRARLREHVRSEGLSGYVLFGQDYIRYFTSFVFLSNERPVVYAQSASGEDVVFVPEFEVERTRAETSFERVESYPEYPGIEHPMLIFARVLADLGLRGPIGADGDGYPGILGYQGPSLSEVTSARVEPLSGVIESMMARKSAAELELIRESGRWCARAHRLLQEYSRVGATEAEASLRAGHEATLELFQALGDDIGQMGSSDGVSAGYRGQIGLRSSWAHAVAHNIAFQPGDVLVTETSAPIWGYNAELERAMIIGEPTEEMRRLFDHTVAVQQVAKDALRPGVTCADVDQAVMKYLEDNALLGYWRQHTGHGIGLRNHEAPFLDVGDHTPVEPGMVFTIEPGLYSDTIGGFRHSDTVAVTPDGIDVLTEYPRDLQSLTIPV